MRDSCQPRNPFCDRQAGCEAGRLNSEQINQAGHSMLLLRLDEELGFGPARPGDFWSYIIPEKAGCSELSGRSGQ
jgi:hypothetical protein